MTVDRIFYASSGKPVRAEQVEQQEMERVKGVEEVLTERASDETTLTII